MKKIILTSFSILSLLSAQELTQQELKQFQTDNKVKEVKIISEKELKKLLNPPSQKPKINNISLPKVKEVQITKPTKKIKVKKQNNTKVAKKAEKKQTVKVVAEPKIIHKPKPKIVFKPTLNQRYKTAIEGLKTIKSEINKSTAQEGVYKKRVIDDIEDMINNLQMQQRLF